MSDEFKMSDFFKMTPGTPPPPRENDENNIYGPGWHALRTSDGFALAWDGGDIVSKAVEVRISEEEFERLRRDPDSFDEISDAHDPYR